MSRQCYYSLMQASGFVLAGGGSTRMGRDKALLPYRGTTLVEHVAEIVREAAGSVALIGDPARSAILACRSIRTNCPAADRPAASTRRLRSPRADWNLMVGLRHARHHCDSCASLLGRAPRHRAPQMCGGRRIRRQPEPLCAVYHRRCLPVLTRAIRDNRLKMRDLVTELGAGADGR